MSGIACWVDFILGTALTVYHGYRGFMFQWILADPGRWKTKRERVVLLCIPDSLFYAVSCASGFLALYLAYGLALRVPAAADVPIGTAVLLVFLVMYGILGVSGQLPYLIQQGKILPPGLKG